MIKGIKQWFYELQDWFMIKKNSFMNEKNCGKVTKITNKSYTQLE